MYRVAQKNGASVFYCKYYVNQFKNRLDKHWKMHDIIFNYRADFAQTGGLA